MASPRQALSQARAIVAPAIYARVSTVDQDCSMQLREGREWMARMGYPKAAEYVDHGISGARKSRPYFDRLMNAAAAPHDLIWVSKIDRFGRSLRHFAESIAKLDELGVRFVAPSQGVDTDQSTPSGRLLLHLLAAFAEFERQLMIERSTAGRMKKFADGQPDSWNLCYGFHKGKPLIDESQAEVMRQAFAWRDDEYSM